MKKIISFLLSIATVFVFFFVFGKLNTKAVVAVDEVCYLQQQETGTGADAKIRYVSTIIGVSAASINGIDVELELSDEDGSNAMVAKADIVNVYDAVNNATEQQDNTLYAVYTLNGVGDAAYVGKVIQAQFVYHTVDGVLKTNTVSHQIGAAVEVGTTYTVKEGSSSAGNGQYITHNLKTIYAAEDDAVDLDGLTIKVDGVKQLLASANVDVVDMSQTIRPVTVQVGNETVTYVTYRVADTLATKNTSTKAYSVVVRKTATTIPGTLDASGNLVFKTINQALDFYRAYSDSLEDSYTLGIDIKPGTYNEKLELNLPNLALKGTAADGVLVQYDALYGIQDISGFVHQTDSTATVAVRSDNVSITNMTIENKYKRIETYASTKYAGSGERGLALLVQADQFVTKYSIYNGWQDTIELFTGRQYFFSCSVSGCVDYIFGTNNTTIFDRCNIITVKGKTSAGSSSTNAYVTAFKGQNKSASDSPDYGTIFNECVFTAENDFVGYVAFVRPWKETSTVAVINSTIDDTYQTEENKTIVTGLIGDVNVSTLKIKFYGITKNAEAVTITDNLSNVDTTLTAEEAANYTNFAKVYAKKNGGVTYLLGWDPETGVVVEQDYNTYYCFNGTEEATGTSYVFGNESVNKTLTKGIMTLDATGGSIAYNSNSNTYNFKKGAKITIADVPAGANVIVYAHSASYAYFTIDGYAPTTDTMTYYNEIEGTVTIVSTGDTYIRKIVVEPNAEAPAAKTLQSITVSNAPANDYAVNEDYDLSSLVVTAIYSDNTKKVVDDYTTNAAAVIDKTSAGTYEVTVTYNGKTAKFNVKYVSSVSDIFEEDIELDFGTGNAANTLANTKITKSDDLRYNNGNYTQLTAGTFSFMVKSGAIVTVTDYGGQYGDISVNGVSTSGKGAIINAEEDMKITIGVGDTGAQYSYLKKITITYPEKKTVISSTTRISFGTEGNIGSIDGVNYSGTNAPNGGNNSKLYGGNITFTVAAGATVQVYGNYNVDYTLNSVAVEGRTSSSSDIEKYTVYFKEETDVTIVCDPDNDGDNYFYWIDITF